MRHLAAICGLSFVLLALSAASSPAGAEEGALPVPQVFLALVRDVAVVVHDNVTDGCWPNPNGARDAVAHTLARGGLSLSSDEGSTYVSLRAVGYETRDAAGAPIGCAVYYKLVASRPLVADVPFTSADAVAIEHPFWERGSLVVGPKDRVAEALVQGFVRLAATLSDTVLLARAEVFAQRPDLQGTLAER
jgi:hypothetical protein